jgi:hypothetical protein
MWRKTFGSFMFLGVVAPPAWAQEAAKPEQAGNPQTWPLILAVGGVIYIVFLIVYVLRRQKLQKRIVDRSLQLS